ncbi:MAG: CBS domain-containing protein [Kiloniellales bacterium]|nr:CBS domain-containing protein [Kiloniellales bacterium]
MQAKDVMTTNVVTVQIGTGVPEIARLLLKHRISAVPVVDSDQRILGIVSEGDLMRRTETDTERRHSWWLEAMLSTEDRAREYIKVHGRKAGDVMTRDLISVTEETPLYEIAGLLEKHHVKRVPVTRDGRLIGIVSRANLLHGFAAKEARTTGPGSSDDQTIRENLLHTLAKEAGLDMALINVIVNDGVVQLWGLVGSGTEKKAAQVSAESTPGVKRVENHLGQAPTVV